MPASKPVYHAAFSSVVTSCLNQAGPRHLKVLREPACLQWLLKRHWKRRALANASRISELTAAPFFRSRKTLDLALNSFCPVRYPSLSGFLKKHPNCLPSDSRGKIARLSDQSQVLRFSRITRIGRTPGMAQRPRDEQRMPSLNHCNR